MRSERFDFAGSGGHRLAGLLQLPDGEPSAYALFAHCFTCGKDVKAAAQLARSLAELGIATLRFDFTGLGASEGEFARTHLHLQRRGSGRRSRRPAPDARGAQAADRAQSRRCGDPGRGRAGAGGGGGRDHRRAVRHRARGPAVRRTPCRLSKRMGKPRSTIAGRSFRVGRELVTDLAGQDQARRIKELGRALAGHARAGRRGGGHRERVADLRRRPPPQELRLARHGRSPAQPARGCRLRGARARGLGIALCRSARQRRRTVAEEGRGPGRGDRARALPAEDHGRPAQPDRRRAGRASAAWRRASAPTICCWPRWAPARR